MTDSMCPSLHRLGMLLQSSYELRAKCLADKGAVALDLAELNLRRIHNLIANHRSFCRHCRFNEALKGIPQRYNDSHSNVASSDRVN
jgi:hypothetical protein